LERTMLGAVMGFQLGKISVKTNDNSSNERRERFSRTKKELKHDYAMSVHSQRFNTSSFDTKGSEL
ncbi:hypothetical protein ACH0C8_15545, partial [Acetobacter lovaniensis]|uniref:hypothetical protein n=1 Tax=Acetobacter lovaniensis TaxID=104100 RepID=UPI00376F7F90